MIKVNRGIIDIKGNVLEVDRDLGNIIFHVFAFADEFPEEISAPAKKMFQNMIIQAMILAGCNDPEQYADRLQNDKKFIKTIEQMIELVNESIELIRTYVKHTGDEE